MFTVFRPCSALRHVPQLHPRAFISRYTAFSTSLLVVPSSITGRGPAHGYSCIYVGGILLTCPIHTHLNFFTSNEMGSVPVRSWSSVLDILFGQKMCRLLLKHLFWNTSSMWHIPLVTFQDSAAYSSTLSTLLLKMRIFVFLLIIFVCHVLHSRKCSSCLVDPCLDFSLCVPSFVTLAPTYVNSVSSPRYCSPSLTGSAV